MSKTVEAVGMASDNRSRQFQATPTNDKSAFRAIEIKKREIACQSSRIRRPRRTPVNDPD
jgi:hypothetical protein